MKKHSLIIVLAAILASSFVFADDASSMMGGSACRAVAKACKAAGYARKDEDKRFWKDCMEPLLLGQSVKKVTIDADKVKACRMQKIDDMQNELKKLQAVQ